MCIKSKASWTRPEGSLSRDRSCKSGISALSQRRCCASRSSASVTISSGQGRSSSSSSDPGRRFALIGHRLQAAYHLRSNRPEHGGSRVEVGWRRTLRLVREQMTDHLMVAAGATRGRSPGGNLGRTRLRLKGRRQDHRDLVALWRSLDVERIRHRLIVKSRVHCGDIGQGSR
jgi:hypothetical protein